MVRTLLSSLMLTLLAVCLSACGGGGGGSSPGVPPAVKTNVVDGTYHMHIFSARVATGSTFSSTWGTAVTNGTGGIDLTGRFNVDSATMNQALPPGSYDLTVSDAGVVQWSLGGVVTHEGGVSDDGQLVILASVANLWDPSILVLTKASSSNSVAELVGEYRTGMLNVAGSAFGPLTGDGAGALSGLLDVNTQNVVTFGGPVAGTATVGMYGHCDLDLSPGILRGALSTDGQFAIWGGDDASTPDLPLTIAGVRTAPGSGPTGEYYAVAMEYAQGPAVASSTGLVTFTGTNAWSSSGRINVEGTISSVTSSGSFAFNTATGQLVMNRTGENEDMVGGVSADGRFIVVSGGSVSGSSTPVLWIFCRR